MKKIDRKLIDCGCGCGEQLMNRDKWSHPRKYVNGHAMRGRKYSKEHCDNIGMGRSGIRHTEEAKTKMSSATSRRYKKGENFGFKKGSDNHSILVGVWNSGLTKETDDRVARMSEKQSIAKKNANMSGDKNPFYGKTHTEETILKIRKARAKQNFAFYNSSIEVKIQGFLRELGIEYMTHFCVKDIEHAYNCDIFIPSMNLVIEADGNYFHGNPEFFEKDSLNEKQIAQKERDNFRNTELVEKGYRILRLWEGEIRGMSLGQFQNKMLQVGGTL